MVYTKRIVESPNGIFGLNYKVEQKPPAGLMAGTQEVSKPWEIVCIDVVGPLPRSKSGHCYILSIMDKFSKFCLFFPMRTATSRNIICDNGRQFTGNEFKKLAQEYSVKISYTALYHPQANACERQHRTLKTMIASYVQGDHRNWKPILQKVACAMRTSASETTKLTPYFINFGREIILNGTYHSTPVNLAPDVINPNADPTSRAAILAKVYKDVKKELNKCTERTRNVYNLRRRDVQFNVGQQVWRRNFPISDAARYFSAKLAPRYVGPFIIARKVSPWTYQL